MPIWSEQTAMEMTRYGIVYRVVSVKDSWNNTQLIRCRLVKRKGNRFDFVGPIKSLRNWNRERLQPGDLLFRDHDTREWTRMQIMTPEEAKRAEEERQKKPHADEVAAVGRGTREQGANPLLVRPLG